MTKQRKLTDDELQKVMAARHDIKQMCEWGSTDRGREYWHGVVQQLNAMAFHATTDGQPWVDPEPPIPEGYRLAVAGDEGRSDCKFWNPFESKWQTRARPGMSFINGDPYIVPADRTPTDEDAKSRPEVMVRDDHAMEWKKQKLVFANCCADAVRKFVTVDSDSQRSYEYRYARHLYPGE